MASPRLAKTFLSKRRRKEEAERKRKIEKRRLHHELLEDRRMMTLGPSLVSVIPTSGNFLHNGDTLNVAPRDITFRFAQGNSIDTTTLANGFIVRSGGPDHVLGDSDDQIITPGFLGLADSPREVIMRFASTLPDNVYSVTLVGSGTTPLKDTAGNPFTSGNPASPDLTLNFALDLGAKVDAIVPQPISRVNNTLQQTDNSIVVYYDQQMNTTDVVQPTFYHLVDATSGSITLPSSVNYSDNATLTIQNTGATLLSYNGTAASSPLYVTDQITRVTINGAGTNNTGTFTLSVTLPPGFNELGHQSTQTTVSIPAFGATPATVLAALNAIPELNGNVAVTAGPGGTGIVEQFDITFQGALTGRAAPVSLSTQGIGTVGGATTLQGASNFTAAAIQSNLTTISALSGKVTVTGPAGGPYNVAFTGTLAGTNTSLVANNLPTASITSTNQSLTLVAAGTTFLSFNGVPASSQLTVVTGASGTTAAQVSANLNTIPALSGHIAVLGAAGGPFAISINTLPTGSGASLITSNTPTVATTVTASQTLALVSNGVSTLSFNGTAATSPLTVLTGTTGTTAAQVQANLATIPALANVTVTGNQGGPFTITFPATAAAANVSLVATSPSAVVAVTSQQPTATLIFANPIAAGTFRLDIGTTPEPSAPEAINNKNYQHVGNSMTSAINAFIGDSLTATSAAAQANDIDLYRFDLQNDVKNFSVTVQPAAGLDAVIRIFDKNGNPVPTALTPINAGGPGAAESTPAGGIQLLAANGPYYVGVSSAGNVAYNAATGASNTGGTTTGGYSLKVTFDDISRSTQTLSLVANDPQQRTAVDGTINPANYTFLSYNGVAATLPAMLNDQLTFVGITKAGPGSNGTFTLSVTLPTQPATTYTTLPIPASGATATDVLNALNAIPGLSGNVAVADDTFGSFVEGFDITFQGALTGVTVPVKFNALSGTVGQSFNFVDATVPNTVTTTAAMIFESLSTIPALQGNISVTGPTGGPFNITFTGALAGTPVSLITTNTPNVAITAIDDRFFGNSTVDNSSFGGATPTGVLGPSGRSISGAIVPTPNVSQQYLINFPGSGDAPGDRQVPYIGESYLQTPVGDAPDPSTGIETVTYDFQDFYGYSPLGDPLHNAITENQKQRTREIFELISRQSGVQFHEVDPLEDGSVQANITVVTGDLRALAPSSVGFANAAGFPVVPTSQLSNPDNAMLQHMFVVLDAGTSGGGGNWGNSEYGGQWFLNAIQSVSQALGAIQHRDLPDLTPQNPTSNTEPVYPTPADVLAEQALHRPEANDIDVYSFTTAEPGLYRAETIAERLSTSTVPNPDLLNTVLTLYKETTDSSGNKTRTEIARNDDYYGADSYLELHLDPGTYYVAVTSTGNTQFDPTIPDTGMGGRTQGAYTLSMSLKPDAGLTSMRDATGVAFDGDGDGNPGGTEQFWFQSNTAGNTVYVDKLGASVQLGHTSSSGAFVNDGAPVNSVTTLSAGLSGATGSKKIVRIIGNGGTDGDPNTLKDDQPYLVGFKDPNLLQPLPDGGTFQVPAGVTVEIDAGAVIKMRKANLNAGTTPQGVVSKIGSSIQVLGTPLTSVQITSYSDDTIGGDSNPTEGPALGPQGGDFGGIVFRDDSDHERDWQNGTGNSANPLNLVMPVFLNYVNHATINYGGGKVTVDSVQDVYDPIYMDKARPTLTYNTIQSSANAAMSASPNTFDDDGLPNITAGGGKLVPFDLRRIGPDIHDNVVGTNDPTKQQLNNSIDGLFVRIRTQAGSPTDLVDLTTRWKATDIVYVLSENLLIAGTPGGSIEPGVPNPTGGGPPIATMIEDGRLRVDPGVIVKVGGARIETKISSQFIAEGTTSLPVIFTSIKDDRYGAGGTFDTNKDGNQTAGAPGQWGGFYFGPASVASLDHVGILFGGGTVPVEGGFDSFNAVETNQAVLRLTNSVLQFNAGGGAAQGDDRNGRGTNDDAVIFVRGAQPIIVGNLIRDNSIDASGNTNGTGPIISINANAMISTVQGDYGRSTGIIDRFTTFDDNHGPLVRGNRLSNNTINGMEVRAETLTTETIWDDTDIAHVVTDDINADNLHVYGGIRLQSSTTASLVVKLLGDTAGLTATGTPLDITDRIGGTVQVIGQPGHPVVLTSLNDDSVSAGFDPSGFPLFDTNNNGASSGSTLPVGPEVNNGTLIDDDVPVNIVGHFEARPSAGGDIGLAVPGNSSSGVTVQGNTQKLINQNFIFQFTNYVDVGSDGTAVDLASTTITMPPTLVSPDLVVSEGNFTAVNNQVINWHVETTFPNGVPTAFSTITFSSTQPLGNLRFINYLDEDVLSPTDDLLYRVGTPGQSNFRLFTLDGPERVGFAQGGIYTPGPGLVNATYDGFAADSFANLLSAITNAGTTYSVAGNINTTNLPAFNDPTLGSVNGLADVTTAMAWTVDPTATTATITSFLELIARNPATSAGDWRSIDLEKNSNDTNVAELLESEPAYVGVNVPDPNDGSLHGQLDQDRTPQKAQLLGNLAPNDKSSDDNRRLGFQVDGSIAMDNPSDVDVYSFNADSGTEVWFDVDNTSPGLNSMIELVDAAGNVLASATDTAPSNPIVTPVAPPTILSYPVAGSTTATTQQIKLSTPTGADPYVFYLTDSNGDKTGPIASNATATAVQTALSSLPGLPLVSGTSVTGNAGGPWIISFSAVIPLLGTPGGFIVGTGPNVDPTIPTLPGLNQNVTASVLAGGIGLAQSFDKDHYNGRDTYSTNPGAAVAVDSGVITFANYPANSVSGSFPVQMTSANHGLATGDRVQIDDATGSTVGVYTVTVQDLDHFTLDGSNFGPAGVFNAAKWTKLVQTTRDPQMRVVLPKAANGTDLKNSPWFIRVRSEPATFAGESGNTLNPGLTSGQYQLQVRIQQQDEKPASTVRFSDIRFATNGIEVHGLPQHSPLAGETSEADTANSSAGNNTQAGAQFIGNLLTVDRNTITVGGQIGSVGAPNSLNDVDWYRFDLNADLTTHYGPGNDTFATMFDIDYADGIARPDTTISVFDETGKLIYVGGSGNAKADQPAAGQGLNANDLSRGSFGPLDPFIGPVQLPAGKTESVTRTYYVAVSSSRSIPSSLNQQFLASPPDQLVRVEPVDSIGRIVQDTLDQSGGTTDRLAENQYTTATGATKSTIFDLTDKQTLSANVVPFNLNDVSLFVSQRTTANRTILQVADPSTGVIDLSNVGTIDSGLLETDDITMREDGTLWGYQSDFTQTGTRSHAGNILQIDPSTAAPTTYGADNIPDPPAPPPPTPITIQYVNSLLSGSVGAIAWGGTADNPLNNSLQEPLYLAVDDLATGVSALYSADWTNGNAFVTQGRIQPGRVFGGNLLNPLDLTNATKPKTSTDFSIPGLLVTFTDQTFGTGGNGRNINFTEDGNMAPGAPPIVVPDATVPTDVDVTFNPNGVIATIAKTFGNNNNGEIDFTAQKLGIGTAANPISVLFQQVATLTGNAKTSVSVTGNNIKVLLNQGNHPTVQNVIDAINNTPNAFALVSAATIGQPGLDVISPQGGGTAIDAAQPNPMILNNGQAPTTVQDLVNAINGNAALSLSVAFQPSTSGNTIIGDEISQLNQPTPPGPRSPYTPGPPITQLTLSGGSGATGFTTGLAFAPDTNTLYGVSENGQFFKVDVSPTRTTASATRARDLAGNPALIFQPTQVSVPGINGAPQFAGLTRGPLNLENGRFANDFFAVTSDGNLVCLDNTGAALPVFDSNGDGVADAYTVELRTYSQGAAQFPTGLFTGLCFSPLDFNLWHPTNNEPPGGGSSQHNIATTTVTNSPVPDQNVDRFNSNNNTSFYFGFDNFGNPAANGNPYGGIGTATGTASTFAGAVSDFTETGVLANNTTNPVIIADGSTITPAINAQNQFAIDPNDPSFGNLANAFPLVGRSITISGTNVNGPFQITNFVTDPTSGLDVISVSPNFPTTGAPPTQQTPQPGDSFTVTLASFTQFSVGPLADSNPNHLIGKNLVFTSGSQANITATTPNPALGNPGIQIANFDPVNNIITLNQALPAVPQDGNAFRIQTVNPASTSRFDASSVGNPPLSSVDDFYDGDTITFDANTLTPQLRNRSFTIQTYLGPSHTFIFQFPLPAKPQDQTANGGTADTFTIQHTTPSAPPEQLPDGGQYGILSRRTQYTGSGTVGLPLLPADRTAQELLDNPLLGNSYNFPGGAYGTLETGQFSLKGIQPGDLPTFYFDYFLDNEDGSSNLNGHNMTDSARVFVGPFTRLNTNIPVTVLSAFVTGSPTPGTTQFNAFSNGLSAVSGIYNGKILQFNNGVLAGQAKVITNYIVNGTTRTFVFANGFSAAPASGDNFSIGTAVTTWDLLSTNNSVLDSSTTSTIDGELPTFLSQSDSAFPQNPRQQVQQLFNNTGTWRQARVDLSHYVGMDNLQFRIDFSSGGTVDRDWTPISQGQATATPFEDAYYTGNFGSLSKNSRLQNNNHVGMYVDNLVVGLAGRGEMVTKSQIDPNVVAPSPRTTPTNWKPGILPPTAVPSGPYQLEIRRGDDYGESLNNINDEITLDATYDLHQQILPDERLTTPPSPIIKDSFETGSLTTNTSIIWSSGGVQPWTVNTTTANTGSFAAASGPIGDSQTSALQASMATGQGTLTFAYNTQADTGDFLRFYIDGVEVTDVNGALTEWDGNSNGFVKETIPVSAGWHIFRWAYQKDNQTGNPGQVFIDDVTFPTPSVGVQDLYADQRLYTKSDAQNNPDNPVQNVLHIGGASLPTGMLRIGDQNLHRTQGNIQITQNSIDSSAQAGILIDAGPRDANSNNPYATVRNLPTLSTDNLVPGVVVANNIVSNSGSVGISLSGDANAAVGGQPVPVSAVPFYRVVNNTVFGGSTASGIGIQVGVNAGPSLLNNIISNTATGISVNPTSTNTTVIGANLFSSNNTNGPTGTNSIIVPSGTQIFRNAAARNFYPSPGSPEVDSSLNTLADRPSIAAVESAVGIPQSPILAPESDLYGQLRLDDPSVSPPPGLGQNIFKDRGAVESADFSRPTAAVFVTDTTGADIVDNDSLHRDRNGNPFDMAIRNTDLTRFVIQLTDVGVGVDDATAQLASQYTLTSDGVPLVLGVDYSFAYDASADLAIFRPASGIWPQNHTYTITVNNSATGVLDMAGNSILPNRATGETSFNIFVGFLFDFGDAPDPTYPTLLASGGARSVVHLDSSGNPDFYLGATITEESDAFQSALADGDKNPDGTSSDDGIQFPNGLAIGLNNTIIVTAHIPTGMTGFLDAWFDLNADGAWTPNEELISHHSLADGMNSFTVLIPAGTHKEVTFARFRLSSAGTSSPVGEAPDGEVEDYQLTLGGPPYQNFNNNLDVNNDGFISPSDALTVINLLNAYGSLALPTNLFTPQGGGPGKADYVDVTGDNFMAPNDALAVISYINSHKIVGGEGEGAASTLAAASAPAATSDASSTAIIPPVLYASSSVVVETRDAARPAILANSTRAGSVVSQDAALLAMSDDSSSGATSKSDSRPQTQTEALSDTAWDDLLTSLASDQQDNDKTA